MVSSAKVQHQCLYTINTCPRVVPMVSSAMVQHQCLYTINTCPRVVPMVSSATPSTPVQGLYQWFHQQWFNINVCTPSTPVQGLHQWFQHSSGITLHPKLQSICKSLQ